jgi:hypothetical protein
MDDNQSKLVQHCVQQRGNLGPLGQSFLKQGMSSFAQSVMDALFIWFWSCRDNRLRRHDGFERVNDWNLFYVSCR